MKKPFKIFIWGAVSTLLILSSSMCIIGTHRLVRACTTIIPYAPILLSAERFHRTPDASRPIFFLGDSSVAQPPWLQNDSPTIPHLLAGELQQASPRFQRVPVIDWSFPGARPFHYYSLFFAARDYSPSLIIIPVNWRSLGPRAVEWREQFAFSELSWYIPIRERARTTAGTVLDGEGISIMHHFYYHLSWPSLLTRGLRMWARTQAGLESPVDYQQLTDFAAAASLIARTPDAILFTNYPAHIPLDSDEVITLRSLSSEANRSRVRILFYITPIHLAEMQRRVAFDRDVFDRSAHRIAALLSSELTTCVNLAGLLNEEEFADNYEHYSEAGKKRIVSALAPVVRELARFDGTSLDSPEGR